MRRARLIGPQLPPPPSFASNSLSAFIYEVNAQRRSNRVRELRPADRLMHAAKELAAQMALDRRIRVGEEMNVWIGTSLNAPRIVDQWAAEMEGWRRNYFVASDLRNVGVGQAVIDSKEPLHIVVVVYD
ncbi:hypothetical protein M3Y99_00556000 [Aphelenchoides fujianensis]|nr:hypothetical protein M3Y99_00556000 [Aphelenchoides fujianensis]